MDNITHEFQFDGGSVRVRCLSDEPGAERWSCGIIPDDGSLPIENYTISEPYSFLAANAALTMYKEKYHLNPSTLWTL